MTDETLGSNVWGGGPTAALVYMKGPWVAGALVNNVWSFGGTSGRGGTRYNMFLTQPFVNYNFGGGWYVGSSPIITANWLAAGNKAWTLPVGANVGRVVKIGGKLPVNFSVGAYYNTIRPEFGATWQLKDTGDAYLLTADHRRRQHNGECQARSYAVVAPDVSAYLLSITIGIRELPRSQIGAERDYAVVLDSGS